MVGNETVDTDNTWGGDLMPANTPIYGFTYPCVGETIDPADFSLLATQIDTKLASLASDEDWALGRYAVRLTPPSQGAIVAGAETQIVAAGSQYTILADGVYVASFEGFLSATTVDAFRIRLRRNANVFFGRSISVDPALASSGSIEASSIPFVAVVGDVISATVLFAGTGAGTVQFKGSIHMMVRIQ